MHLLIVKHGALGDVVRTSYVAEPLRRKYGDLMRLSWLTSPASVPLIRFNPFIDDVWTSVEEARTHTFDRIYSLDDERQVLESVAQLRYGAITGAHLDGAHGGQTYTDDSAEWFDMGLLSKHGKARADELKKINKRGHAEIFARMFSVEIPTPTFFGNPRLEAWAESWMPAGRAIGVNPFAGGRWPSKELRAEQLRDLVAGLLSSPARRGREVVLIGAGKDHAKNVALAAQFPHGVHVANTEDSVLRLAAIIRHLDAFITSDSLAMHLAIAQGTPTVAFFAPTSAAEIDSFGKVAKVASTSSDYCSYRPDADNSTVTASRIMQALLSLARL